LALARIDFRLTCLINQQADLLGGFSERERSIVTTATRGKEKSMSTNTIVAENGSIGF
jgi:hypothetical protein